MHNQQSIDTTNNNNITSLLAEDVVSLAKPIYDFYPLFDSQSFLTLISVICKQHNVDNVLQQMETEFIRPNVYRLNIFPDCITLLYAEMQKSNSKNNIYAPFINIVSKIHQILQTAKAQQQNNDLQYEVNVDKNLRYYQEIVNIIANEISAYATKQTQYTDNAGQQLTFDIATDNNLYSLSPTQGLAFLNKNPYRFFIEKVLGIKAVNDWEENVNTRLYGIVIHKQLFLNIAMQILFKYRVDNNIVLQDKLDILSNLAVEIERKAKQQSLDVLCEMPLSHIFNQVKITAKADRIEINHKTKEIYIYDYKTGQLPTQQQELKGEKTQLAIIAILLLQHEQYKHYCIKKMQYICLSGRDKDNRLSNIDTHIIPEIQDNLLNLIDYFFTNGKPNYDKFVEIKPSSSVFDKTELSIKYLSRISNFITLY